MEKYRRPPTFEVTDQTRLADWKKWQKSFRTFALASNLVEKSHDFQLSSFKSLLGERALEIYRSFSIVDTTDVESVILKFDEHFGPKVNVTRERYKFYRLTQKPGQRFDDFLSDITNQVDKCGFRSMRDEIVVYKIVGGIVNEDVREALLADENLQYEKAVRVCRASTEMHWSRSGRCGEDIKEQIDPVENRNVNYKLGECRKKNKKRPGMKQSKSKAKHCLVDTEEADEQDVRMAADVQDVRMAADVQDIRMAAGVVGVGKIGSPDEEGLRSGEVEEAGSTNAKPSAGKMFTINEPMHSEREPDSPVDGSLADPDSDWRPDDDLEQVISEKVSPWPSEKPKTKPDDSQVFSCDVCGKVFSGKKSLKRHSLVHLRKNVPSRDDVTPKTAEKSKIVKPHGKTLPGVSFSCEVCGKAFPRMKSLKRHSLTHARGRKLIRSVKTHEEKSTSLSCEVCSKVFPHKNSLRRHRLIHAEAKIFACHYCQEKFAVKYYIRRHMWRIHPEKVGVVPKVHFCDECDYKTTEWRNMKRHRYKHSDVKPLSCELCDYQCIVRSQMISHMAKHKGEKPYACSDCDFRSRSDSCLSVHRRLKHSDEKPFVCNVCGNSFKLRVALRSHMNVHTGHRPYACTLCDSKFKQSAHLSYHMRTHTGEKPYVCDICGHRWAIQGNLTAHMKIHNKQSDPRQNSPPRKRQKKPNPDLAVEAPAPAAIPQWSEQISTINPVECFTGLEPYQPYPLGMRPAESDCQYYQQRPPQWPNTQNVSNAMPVIASDDFH